MKLLKNAENEENLEKLKSIKNCFDKIWDRKTEKLRVSALGGINY